MGMTSNCDRQSQKRVLAGVVLLSASINVASAQQVPLNLRGVTTDPLPAINLQQNSLSPAIDGRQNVALQPVGDVTGSVNRLNADDGSAPGISLGSLTLRPTLENQVLYESETSGGTSTERVYNQTNLGLRLQSNWARHSLEINGEGTFESNISGDLQEDPSAGIAATLSLDLSDLFRLNLTGDYDYSVESRNDPNALSDATGQADVHDYGAALSFEKNVGILQGSVGASVAKTNFGNATLSDGTIVSGDDRDLTISGLSLRLQQAGTPAFMPFIEGRYSRGAYDQKTDSSGTERSYTEYDLRLGVERDLGEKLSSEVSLGYSLFDLDDSGLKNISTVLIDGAINWSPKRGTNVNLGVSTDIEPSTSSGVSGSALYALNGNISQAITSQLTGAVGANYSVRQFTANSTISNQTIYGVNVGLDWLINRYVSLGFDAAYNKTTQNGETDRDNVDLGVGLTLTR